MLLHQSAALAAESPTYRDEQALAIFLAQELERRLAGRHLPMLVRQAPGDVCHLGVLAPVGARDAAPAPADGTGAADMAGGGHVTSTPPRTVTTSSARRPPASLGVQLLIAPDLQHAITLRVRPRFAIYSRHFATWDEQRREFGDTGADDLGGADAAQTARLLDVCVRRSVTCESITFTIDPAQLPARLTDSGQVQQALTDVLHQARAAPGRPLWRPPGSPGTVTRGQLQSPVTYAAFLSHFTPPAPSLALRAALDVRARRTAAGHVLIQIYVCNITPSDGASDAFNVLADSGLQVVVQHGTLLPIELIPVPEDYQYDRAVWAVGHACSAVVSTNRRVIQTRTLAQYRQPRLGTRDDPPAPIAHLATNPIPVLEHIFQAMQHYAEDWQSELDAWTAAGPAGDDEEGWMQEQSVRKRDLDGFRQEIERFAGGIAALHADARLLSAFAAMQRVFGRVATGQYDAWRLFQIVFIVSALPALAIREGISAGSWPHGVVHAWPDVLERVDVLWFPTGGGKTEAYFGLIACAILYDRLRGKAAGVTAWLRFPLRMLSVQQLQRAIVLIYETEQERQALVQHTGQPLGDPIALGYLVGKDMTPNRLHPGDPTWPLDHLASDPVLLEKLHLVRHCPACPTTRGTVTVQIDTALGRIRLVCSTCGLELPIYASDSEVLRFLPSLIIGTVDKLASVAYRAALAALWRGPTWRCPIPGHGYGVGRYCAVEGCPTNPKGAATPKKRLPIQLHDPAPALHVQDELHLLQQELGTFAGHYATMLRAAEKMGNGLPSKIIAATATIEGYAHQARQVYGVASAARFPGRDRHRTDTFYTQLLTDAHGRPQIARVFLAFQPPQLTAIDAATLCTTILHAIVAQLYQNPYAAIITAGLKDAQTADAVHTLLSRYDTAVTYVGTKHSGTRIAEALERTSIPKAAQGGADDLAVRFLSGDTPFGEIAKTVDDLIDAPPWSDANHLDSLVATSVISHGVDVSRLNLLIMDHVPDVPEYIQASSRSGRRHVGLVVAVLPRLSARASSIYQRFQEFHTQLERRIGPVPINRFAKDALARTFPGVVLGALFSQHLRQAGHAVDVDTIYGPLATLPLATVVALAEAAYGLGQGIYAPMLEAQARAQIADEAALLVAALARQRATRQIYLRDAFEPPPMRSLRDVDVALPFALDDAVDERDLRPFRRRVGADSGE
jgi:hypothetical protein